MLYCTVCDYNNGDCEIHNTMDKWEYNIKLISIRENHMKKIMALL